MIVVGCMQTGTDGVQTVVVPEDSQLDYVTMFPSESNKRADPGHIVNVNGDPLNTFLTDIIAGQGIKLGFPVLKGEKLYCHFTNPADSSTGYVICQLFFSPINNAP